MFNPSSVYYCRNSVINGKYNSLQLEKANSTRQVLYGIKTSSTVVPQIHIV